MNAVPKAKLYLSKRNLLALLSKLERDEKGDDTACAIIKHQQPEPAYQQTMKTIMVIAVQDAEYYNTRSAGEMHPDDEQHLPKPKGGIEGAFIL
jgi:hypothetical protein